jgi:hypothetical protein
MHWSLTATTFVLGPAWVAGSNLLVYDGALALAWWVVVAVVVCVNGGHLSPKTTPQSPQSTLSSLRT